MKTYKFYIVWIFTLTLAMSSCNDYLDVVPKGDVQTIESIFEQREDAYDWLKTCYYMLTAEAATFIDSPGYLGADEYVAGQYLRNIAAQYTSRENCSALFIGDGLQSASNPYHNIWTKDRYFAALRYCNIYLENCPKCGNMPESEKKISMAEIKALKAHLYFEMFRRYGPIILVPKNIPANSSIDEMQQPRQPIDTCVNAIVRLCDEAIKDLPLMRQKETSRYAYYNKEAAATLKAYTLLYAASPLFNGNTQFIDFKNKNGERMFPDYDKEKWHRAAVAADEALQYCLEGGKELYSGSSDQETPLLNTIKDIRVSSTDNLFDNKETILAFNKTQANSNGEIYRVPSISSDYEASAYWDMLAHGCLGASMKMVEMFYTENGLPLDEDKQWLTARYRLSKEADSKYRNVLPLNTDVLTLHRRREPRFYADLAPDGTYWVQPRTVNGSLQDVPFLVDAKQGGNLGVTTSTINSNYYQCLSGYWVKKGIDPTLSLYRYTMTVRSRLQIVMFRLAEVYLMAAEAWNEYLDKPNQHVYDMINAVRERAGIPDVQTAWRNYSKHPEKVETQAGMRDIIRQEWNIEFAFEGRRFWNLRRWMTAPQELNQPQYGWNVISNTNEGFYNNYEGPIVVWSKRKFTAPRDYFWPIRAEEVLISGVKQNKGW